MSAKSNIGWAGLIKMACLEPKTQLLILARVILFVQRKDYGSRHGPGQEVTSSWTR